MYPKTDIQGFPIKDKQTDDTERESKAVGEALAKASVFQFTYVFIIAVAATLLLKFPYDVAGVIAFLIAFVSFTPYFAFFIRGVFQKKT